MVRGARKAGFQRPATALVPPLLLGWYLLLCAFFALHRLQLPGGYYEMHGRRKTDENSLLFSGGYMLRLVG